MIDAIEQNLLREVADLDSLPVGAYNIRANGQLAGRNTTANIDIVTKDDKPGIDIYIRPFTKNESVHIPVILSQTGLTDLVYNDFHIGEGADVTIIPNPQVVELSSTEVRQTLAQGGGAELLPAAVYGYILRERLYSTHRELTGLTPDELRPIALSYLKPKRMPHVLGTEQEAVRLTRRYGGDETQARIAALLHDCTKKLELPEQLALCAQYGIELDELEQRALKLLHSKTGAAIARSVFGVEDAVYDAIWYHTTGKPDMTRLEKILYLADYIEPSRDFPGVEELRKAVYEDLDHGLLLGLSMTIQEMEEMGNPVHHQTRDARDYLLKRGIR